MDHSNIEFLLKSILDEIRLLTVQTKADAIRRFHSEFLTSDMRKKAYEKFDGTKTLKEISEEINCKLNSLQVFVSNLVEKDLVDVTKQGNSQLVSKSISKIAVYYANNDLAKKEELDG